MFTLFPTKKCQITDIAWAWTGGSPIADAGENHNLPADSPLYFYEPCCVKLCLWIILWVTSASKMLHKPSQWWRCSLPRIGLTWMRAGCMGSGRPDPGGLFIQRFLIHPLHTSASFLPFWRTFGRRACLYTLKGFNNLAYVSLFHGVWSHCCKSVFHL